MRITLTAYSILRELLPVDSGGKMEVELSPGETVADLLKQVGLPEDTACAINDSIQRDLTTLLHEGDRVSVFRPGSGGESQGKVREPIGLIAAMHAEAQELLNLTGKLQRMKIGTFSGYRFVIAERECILIESGWGANRAYDATIQLIKNFKPGALVLFGIAGAVEVTLKIGDVVEISNNCILEKDRISKPVPLSRFSKAEHKAIVHALKTEKADLFEGTAITTKGSQLIQAPESIMHPVLEMETAGVLKASKENSLPLFSVRAVSDGPTAPIPFDLASMMDDDYNLKIGKLLWTVIRHPMLLFHSSKLTRNTALAERNAAIAILAALNLPSPSD